MQQVTGLAFRNQFLANPQGFLGTDLVTYPLPSVTVTAWNALTANALMCGPLGIGDGKRPIHFSMRRFDHADGVDVRPVNPPENWTVGGAKWTVDIDPNDATAAYFLPWVEDGGYHTILGTDADLFFTALMSGCALGWSRGADGSVRIAHANIQGPDGTDEAAMAQALSIYDHRLLPSDYRVGGGGCCNVVGVRTAGGWTLYAQKFDLGCNPPYVIDAVAILPM